eukprot:GHRR01035177.1.p1 GENE.GHRR01035177.1~~GHRR01035177.1.p1  ORF type:complete len:110 (+),score=11.03 GHRR01035177.1:355-684(+)
MNIGRCVHKLTPIFDTIGQKFNNSSSQELGILGLGVHDLLLQLLPALVPEGWHTRQHLIQQDASTPPVHCTPMAHALNDLRGHVFHCANEAVGPARCQKSVHELLGAEA